MKRIALTLVAALLVAACSDSTAPGQPGTVSLSFTTGSAGPAPAAPGLFLSAAAIDLTDGSSNTLTLDRVEVVLREIELQRVEVVDCDVEPEPDGCEKFEAGPLVLDLVLDGQVEQKFAIPVDPGMYDEIEFEIHKVTGDDPAAFLSAHSDLMDKSIRVQGSFNGQPFTYENDLDVEQEFDFPTPLIVDETTSSANVTVLLDVDAWFRDGSGNLVNPQDGNKGGQHESLIKENIKQSTEAFEDHDSDGEPDIS
jgi:hypothetical protein